MSVAHIHLVLAHAPVFGILFASLGLAWALFRQSEHVAKAALVLLIIAGVLVLPVYLSGENAEDTVEEQVGVSHDAIEAHEDGALGAAIATGVVGFVALLILVGFRRRELSRAAIGLVLVLAIGTGSWIGYVGSLGGKINHPELRGATANSDIDGERGEGEENHDDENGD